MNRSDLAFQFFNPMFRFGIVDNHIHSAIPCPFFIKYMMYCLYSMYGFNEVKNSSTASVALEAVRMLKLLALDDIAEEWERRMEKTNTTLAKAMGKRSLLKHAVDYG